MGQINRPPAAICGNLMTLITSRESNAKMKKFIDRYLFSRLGLQILFSVVIILLFSFLGTKLRTIVTNHQEQDVYSQTFWGFRQITDGGSMAGTLDELDSVEKESGNSYGAPVVLAIALISWLIGMVLYSFVTGAVVNAFEGRKDKIEGGKARYKFKNHGVVIGWDFQGVAAVMALLDTWGMKEVLVISEKPSEEIRGELENELDEKSMDKVYIYNGSLGTDESVDSIYPDKASVIIVLGDRNDFDNDGGNLRIGGILRNKIFDAFKKNPRGEGKEPIRIFIEVSNPYNLSLAEMYPAEGFIVPKGLEIHVVNFCKSTVRELFSSFAQFIGWNSGRREGVYETAYTPLHFRGGKDVTHVHLVVSGIGDMAKTVVRELAPLIGADREAGRITVFSSDADEIARFEAAYPFESLLGVKVEFVPSDIESSESRSRLVSIVKDETASVTIILTGECADETFATANRLPHDIRFENVRLLVEQRILAKWAHKRYPLSMTGFKNVEFFGFIDRHFLSMGQKLELDGRIMQGEKLNGTRDRFFASSFTDGLLENLAAHGYSFEYNPTRDRKPVVDIPEDERDGLARTEHYRNVNCMLLNGVTPGEDDAVFKTSRDIVPYEDVDPARREAYVQKIGRALATLAELYNCGEFPYIVERQSFRKVLGILPDETVEESASARMKLRKDAINGLRDDSVWRTPEGKSKSRPLLAVVLTPGKGLARQMYRLAFLMNLHMIVVLPCDRKSYLERFAAAEREYIEHWLRAAHEIVVAEGSVEDAIRSISRDILVLADGKWTVKSL